MTELDVFADSVHRMQRIAGEAGVGPEVVAALTVTVPVPSEDHHSLRIVSELYTCCNG